MDDMVDTAGTLCKAAQALKEARRQARAGLLHAPGAVRQRRRAHQQSVLDELVVTDTIPLRELPRPARASARSRSPS
jgi:ribose-phosphate pyrophosphokinase